RIGVAAMYAGENEKARQALSQAGDLANELDMYSIASRAWSALSNLMCHAYDDVMAQLWYAERAAEAATKSCDTLELQTALLQVAAAEMRRGNAEESAALEEQLATLKSDPRRAHLMAAFKSLRLAWDGKFAQAHETLSSCWDRMHHGFDRVLCGAQCALFLALDGRRDSSIRLIQRIRTLAEDIQLDGLYPTRCVALALLLCVVAEVANQRLTAAKRLVKKIQAQSSDDVIFLSMRIAEHYVRESSVLGEREVAVAYERLRYLGYADIVRLLEVASLAVESQFKNAPELTRAELSILRLLGEGLSPKEIAERDGRSVYTVRAHIANTIVKLKCRGRAQAVATARKLQIIS
ncbi:MAG: LuxR C-terminal-related transcriptional regulator, partial [Candidatus Tumulicola sp.]